MSLMHNQYGIVQCHPQFGFKCTEGNDDAIKYYTGLKDVKFFNDVFSSSPCINLGVDQN